MMKLERLRIDKFRNVKPGSDIRFADGFNIVLGRNGTGKTTLLDLISRIVRWDFSDLEREEFAIAYELTLDDCHIFVELANRKVVTPLTAPFIAPTFSGQRERQIVGMVARIRRGTNNIEAEIVDGHLRLTGEVPAISLPSYATPDHGLLVLITIILHVGLWPFAGGPIRGRRFDESLDLFRSTWGSNLFPGKALQFAAEDSTLKELRTPSDELLRLFTEHSRVEPAQTSFTATHDKLKFLATAIKNIGFISSEVQVDVLGRSGRQDLGFVDLGNMIARFFFADGGFITQDRLSYGQKRLLMFYYYLASNPDIVIADELVNGLHHQWITACIDEIGERQAFLTSQNPLLLDYLPFSSAEQVRKSFVLCTSELDEQKKLVWTWSNMSEEAANEFFSAYQVGIEHVSEILQSQGLF